MDEETTNGNQFLTLPTQVRRQTIIEGLVGDNLFKAPNPYSETPVTPDNFPPSHDERPRLHKIEPEKALQPQLNKVYDSLRTTQAWRYIGDSIAYGGPVAVPAAGGGAVSAPVNLASPPNLRLSQWPGAVSVYPVIITSMLSVLAQPTTAGVLVVWFQGPGGAQILLGMGNDSTGNTVGTSIQATNQIIINSPITDPSNLNMGSINAQIISGAGSTINLYWALQFGYAYLLPEIHGYEQVEVPPYVAWSDIDASVTTSTN